MGRYLLRNELCILGGVLLVALVFLPWFRAGDSAASGFQTFPGKVVVLLGVVVATLGAHPNFGRIKGVLASVSGVIVALISWNATADTAVPGATETTYWPSLSLVLALLVVAVGLIGLFLGQPDHFDDYLTDAGRSADPEARGPGDGRRR